MKKNIWILGPCSIENEKIYLGTAEILYEIMENREWYFKASFDKANRTSIHGGRGPGLSESVKMFKKVKKMFPDIKLTTDVHESWQVEKLAKCVDVVQVPAFLCRQTDLVVECAKYFNIVNIKKGQWLGPRNIIKTVDKIKETNPQCQAWLTERGSSFGHEHLIVDFTIVDAIKDSPWDKFILDCTHSVQRSRAIYGVQGDRDLAEKYLLIAGIMGYDGVFAETHPDPPNAVSDGDCQLFLHKVKSLIDRFDHINKGCHV